MGADGSAQQGALDRLFGKLRSGTESFENGFERLKNRLLLFGPYTDAELAMQKELEIQKVLADPSKIYVISCKTNAAISYAIRGSTYQLGDNDSVNHTALAFQNPDDGQMYILEIELGRSGPTDLSVTKFEDWAAGYVEIQAQTITYNATTTRQIYTDVILAKYVTEEMQPKINIKYNYSGAIFGGGLNLPVSESLDTRFCSSLVYDIIRQAGITLPGISLVPDPNELRHAIDKYQGQVTP